MFGPRASTPSFDPHPFAFLDSGRQYVTMIRDVLPLRPPSTPTPKKLSIPSFTSSSSSSLSSTCSNSLWNDSSSDEEELETPPASPQTSQTTLALFAADRKGKSKQSDLLQFPFSLSEVSEDDDAQGDHRGDVPHFDWTSPSSAKSTPPLVPSSASPSLDESLALPSKPTFSSSTPLPTSSHRKPSRAEEERYRGRTRSPRLLWRSELDRSSMKLLDVYYEGTVGDKLPILKSGMGKEEVEEWSRRIEEAGI
ncbi:uncharacterized protein JCM6883_003859 [Sporobolomyces salmoneus]|uniref:uncharacterized protein n=1 Tax=Sporobolomyces salmoneus TaxID=183962 RepID=UPI00317A30CE